LRALRGTWRSQTRGGTSYPLPETNVFFFGVLLNLPWELLQVPLFDGMSRAPHWQATKVCSLAAVGDGALLVGAYWVTSALAHSRQWVLHPRLRDVLVLLSVGQALQWLFLPPLVIWIVRRQIDGELARDDRGGGPR
jgi:hypothetical protein